MHSVQASDSLLRDVSRNGFQKFRKMHYFWSTKLFDIGAELQNAADVPTDHDIDLCLENVLCFLSAEISGERRVLDVKCAGGSATSG